MASVQGTMEMAPGGLPLNQQYPILDEIHWRDPDFIYLKHKKVGKKLSIKL